MLSKERTSDGRRQEKQVRGLRTRRGTTQGGDSFKGKMGKEWSMASEMQMSSGKYPPTRLGEMLVTGDVRKNGFNTGRRDRRGGGVTGRQGRGSRQDFGELGVRRKETNWTESLGQQGDQTSQS